MERATKKLVVIMAACLGINMVAICACDDEVDKDNAKNSGENDNEGKEGGESQYTDLNQYYEELEEMFGGVFTGVIKNGSARSETVPCEYDGMQFEIVINPSSSIKCYDSEGHPEDEVNCTNANMGDLDMTGTFKVGDNVSIPLSGSADIRTRNDIIVIMLGTKLDYESQYPKESFECYEEEEILLEDEISGFKWSKRHSEEDAEDVIWEICNCNIEEHVQN